MKAYTVRETNHTNCSPVTDNLRLKTEIPNKGQTVTKSQTIWRVLRSHVDLWLNEVLKNMSNVGLVFLCEYHKTDEEA